MILSHSSWLSAAVAGSSRLYIFKDNKLLIALAEVELFAACASLSEVWVAFSVESICLLVKVSSLNDGSALVEKWFWFGMRPFTAFWVLGVHSRYSTSHRLQWVKRQWINAYIKCYKYIHRVKLWALKSFNDIKAKLDYITSFQLRISIFTPNCTHCSVNFKCHNRWDLFW